jgi:hypothetical protein
MSDNRYFSLEVSQPCHEDWSKMTASQKGRFCDSCQKEVIDFTAMTDSQIIDFFQNYTPNQSLCGHLDNRIAGRLFERRPIATVAYQPAFWRKWAAILALSTGILGSTPVQATNFTLPQRQTALHIPPIAPKSDSDRANFDKDPLTVTTYTGIVLDTLSTGTPRPVAGVKVKLLLGTWVSASATTNQAGEFTLDLPNAMYLMAATDIKLHFELPGYVSMFKPSTREELQRSQPIQIFLQPIAVAPPPHQIDGGISFHEYKIQKESPKQKQKQKKQK